MKCSSPWCTYTVGEKLSCRIIGRVRIEEGSLQNVLGGVTHQPYYFYKGTGCIANLKCAYYMQSKRKEKKCLFK